MQKRETDACGLYHVAKYSHASAFVRKKPPARDRAGGCQIV